MDDDKQLTVVNEFMPALTFTEVATRRNSIIEFTRKVMVKDVDYGAIPGTDKPTLLKPGAEKLCTLFGLTPRFKVVASTVEWGGDGKEPLFFYHYSCGLYRRDYLIAEGEGSCNSHEKKYRYRWVNEQDIPEGVDKTKLKTRGGRTSEFSFAIDKAETSGQYGKPAEYWKRFQDAIANSTATATQRKTRSGKMMDAWEIDTTMYCIPNEDIAEQLNTIQKMGQKRALIAAVLIGVNASEFFTQDVEDVVIEGVYTVDTKPVETTHGVERAVNKETGEVTETDPFPPDFGDHPVVTQRKAEVVQAIVEHEQKHEGKPPVAEHEYGGVVIAWKNTKSLTGLENPTIEDIYRKDGTKTLQWIADGAKSDDRQAMKDIREACRQFLAHLPADTKLPQSSNNAAELIARAEAIKAERPYAPEAVRKLMETTSNFYANQPMPAGANLDGLRGAIKGELAKWGDDESQHMVLDYLFGVKSTTQLNWMQSKAMQKWIARRTNDNNEWEDTDATRFAQAEFLLIADVYRIEHGQTKLF